MLEVQSISKYYGDTMAIADISFCAKQGEVIGLLGHNGCGKSTTMGIITGCLAPSGGDARIDGVSILEQPLLAKRKIGYLPEIPPVYPDMTVNEQLRFACGLRGVPKKQMEQEIALACEDLHISGVRNRLIGNLSKGYRQRVGFAQALIGRPPLLVLDEPTVGLDPQQIMELRELIVRLKASHTILISSHILSEIAATCDRIVVLSNGHLVADDTLEGLVGSASGSHGLILQADGDSEKIIAEILALDGVENCALRTSLSDGMPEYVITVKKGLDIHRALFDALAAQGSPIRTLYPAQDSLESIFLKLTQDRRYFDGEERQI